MHESADIKDLFLRWCDRLSAKDLASFDQLVSADPATLVIGTAPGEWVTERPRLRYGFETEGVRLDPRTLRGMKRDPSAGSSTSQSSTSPTVQQCIPA